MFTTALASAGDPIAGGAFPDPCYRIPALAVSASGRLVAAWDARADWRDLPGPFDVVYRTSDDNGNTWTPPRYLRHHEGSRGFGDASLLVDPASGDLLCWYVSSEGRSFFDAETGPDGQGLRLWLGRSSDDGETWHHRDMTSQIKPAQVTGMFASSGNGISLRSGPASGRLLQPFVLRDVQGLHWAAIARSDDGGLTWTLGEPIGPDCDENKVVEIPDDDAPGGVLLHARAKPRRRQASSTDGGASFSVPEPHQTLVDPACNGGLAAWNGTLVCSLLNDPEERRNLGLRFSSDSGRNWSAPIAIDTGAAGYSVLARLADGSLGVLWEAGDYEALIFARVTTRDVDFDRIGQPDHQPGLVPVRSVGGSAKPPEVTPA